MRVVCAWCKCELPSAPCVEKMNGQISHGICEKCNERLMQ